RAELGLGNSDAGVFDFTHHAPDRPVRLADWLARNRYAAASRELECVADQVDDHLAQLGSVRLDGGQLRIELDTEFEALVPVEPFDEDAQLGIEQILELERCELE